MPMPKPGEGQSHDDFIAACMAHDVMVAEFPDSTQRYAACQSQWDADRSERARIETRAGGEIGIETHGLARLIRGHAIVFDQPSVNLGDFREVIAPEAVDRTIRERVDLRALVDHDPSKILGRLSAQTLRVAKDTRGLQIEIDPPETSIGRDIVESLRRRDITGMSFSFLTLKETWNESTTPWTRTIRDMVVREVSIVTFPAYPQTEVALRSLTRQRGLRPGQSVTARLAALERRRF